MITFIYDGSFEGLLTCVFQSYKQPKPPQIIAEADYQEELFNPPFIISTDHHQAERVYQKLCTLGHPVIHTVECCYLSNDPHKATIILHYIKSALIYTTHTNNYYTEPTIGAALDCMRQVTWEAHRFKGLLRFQELRDGLWYAPCEPDHCIIPLLTTHCRERFPQQQWIIHDTQRHTAAFYDGTTIQIQANISLANFKEYLSTAEKEYQNLWKTFFTHIAIQERKNPKLQKQFMPKRYWKHLIEKQ